jgi:hypothetical protein
VWKDHATLAVIQVGLEDGIVTLGLVWVLDMILGGQRYYVRAGSLGVSQVR